MKREYGFWSAFLGMADPSPKQEQIKNKSMKYDHSQIFYMQSVMDTMYDL